MRLGHIWEGGQGDSTRTFETPKSLPVSKGDLSPPASYLSESYEILGDTKAQFTNYPLPSPAGALLDLRPAPGEFGWWVIDSPSFTEIKEVNSDSRKRKPQV